MAKRTPDQIKSLILICNGSDCKNKGAKCLQKCARKVTRDMGAKKQTMFVKTKCTGLCKQAPVVVIQPANKFVLEATEKSVEKALRKHLAV